MKPFSSRILSLVLASIVVLASPLDSFAQSSRSKTSAKSDTSEGQPKKPKKPIKWPIRFTVPMSSHLETAPKRNDKSEQLIYETENFIFYSPVHLQRKARERLARIFECGLAANLALSDLLPIRRMHIVGEAIEEEAAALKADENFVSQRPKMKAILFKTMEDYYAAGAPPSSAGVYRYSYTHRKDESGLKQDEVLVPLPSMGILPDGKVEERTVDSHVLVHELTHQCTVLNTMPIWINEALSEYVGYISTKSYSLNFSSSPKRIQDEGKKAPSDSTKYPFSLHDFFTMSQASFSSHMGKGTNTYLLAAVSATYFLDLNGKDGRERLVAYMTALNEGTPNEEALELLLEPKQDFEDLQKDFIKKAKKLKVKIEFESDED